MAKYNIPDEYFFRIHHVRPRFKNDVESVLLFMASEVVQLSPGPKSLFKEKLNAAIRLYPGNGGAKEKTINNWRTEISSLFGLFEYEGETQKPGRMALLLSENQDLVEFFRYFLFYFQYPGGHLKSREAAKMIQAGIRFKPARYLIEVLFEGQKLSGDKRFGINKAEATHCIFNDLRVTRDRQKASVTARNILRLREAKYEYETAGDVVRYAGDILDYMELADLVYQRPNYKYYLNTAAIEVLQAFTEKEVWFANYDGLYTKKEISPSEVAAMSADWFHFVNNSLESKLFQADILSLIGKADLETTPSGQSEFINEVLQRIREMRKREDKISTKEIGDVGESIVLVHEKNRLLSFNQEALIHLIKKLPESLGVGYDIRSFEGETDLDRFIEVKTTVSRGKVTLTNFNMTENEWRVSKSHRHAYFVYRLAISSENLRLFVIQDPVGKFKQDLIDIEINNGVSVRYSEKSGFYEDLRL